MISTKKSTLLFRGSTVVLTVAALLSFVSVITELSRTPVKVPIILNNIALAVGILGVMLLALWVPLSIANKSQNNDEKAQDYDENQFPGDGNVLNDSIITKENLSRASIITLAITTSSWLVSIIMDLAGAPAQVSKITHAVSLGLAIIGFGLTIATWFKKDRVQESNSDTNKGRKNQNSILQQRLPLASTISFGISTFIWCLSAIAELSDKTARAFKIINIISLGFGFLIASWYNKNNEQNITGDKKDNHQAVNPKKEQTDNKSDDIPYMQKREQTTSERKECAKRTKRFDEPSTERIEESIISPAGSENELT